MTTARTYLVCWGWCQQASSYCWLQQPPKIHKLTHTAVVIAERRHHHVHKINSVSKNYLRNSVSSGFLRNVCVEWAATFTAIAHQNGHYGALQQSLHSFCPHFPAPPIFQNCIQFSTLAHIQLIYLSCVHKHHLRQGSIHGNIHITWTLCMERIRCEITHWHGIHKVIGQRDAHFMFRRGKRIIIHSYGNLRQLPWVRRKTMVLEKMWFGKWEKMQLRCSQ